MLVSEAIAKINYALRGLDDSAPESGSDEWNYWLSVLNTKKDELYKNAKLNLTDTFDVREVGTITASAAPEYTLDDDFIAPSDSIYCVDDDDRRTDFTLIAPKERNPRVREVFIAGVNPKTLYFTNEILSTDNIVGATLNVPGYYLPEDMTTASDDLPFSDPYWAVFATAAEIAFNDLVYEDKAPDLQTKANNLWEQLVSTNRTITYGNTRKVPTRVQRIMGTDRR
jgi:hypothetical protein